jgi:hypothetical protein
LESIALEPETVDGLLPPPGIPQQGREITKEDAWFGKIWNVPHPLAKIERRIRSIHATTKG